MARRPVSDSLVIQELVSTRAALEQAIGIGERLDARIAAALAIAEQLPPIPSRALLIAALKGEK